MQEHKHVVLISLDCSSAFDTVDHDLLLKRLKFRGNVTNKALQLLSSYLAERTFSIKVEKKMSKPRHVKYGVPQGSILGPQFYNLYTSVLEDVITDCNTKLEMYADDILMFFSFSEQNEQEAKQQANLCLKKVHQWMNSSFLKLNCDKTVVKIFSPRKHSLKSSFNLTYESIILTPSDSLTFLGTKLKETFKLSSFIVEKVRKCNFI